MKQTYKDLTVGDKIAYKDVLVTDGHYVSGEGTVFGFGTFDDSVMVWIQTDEGSIHGVPYENCKKVGG